MPADSYRSLPKHVRAPSSETNASGIADSTMSYDGSTMSFAGLAHFPAPPTLLPSSSGRSDYSMTPPSTPRALPVPRQTQPLTPRKPGEGSKQTLPSNAVPSESSHVDTPPAYTRDAPSVASTSIRSHDNTPSPYDWADGASSIEVDNTESRLLSTSFITSLLQEGGDRRSPQRYQQSFIGSDAMSSISEITYPPLAKPVYPTTQIHRSPGNARPTGGRPPPPSAFVASGRHSTRTSASESSTLYDTARGQSLGAAVTLLANNSEEPLQPPRAQEDGNESPGRSSPLLTSTRTTSRHYREGSIRDRQSVHSSKGSFISRISKALKRNQKPLPPVPFLPHLMSLNDELAFRQADEGRPLPELINRAGALSDALAQLPEKDYEYHGYQSHRSLSTIADAHSAPLKDSSFIHMPGTSMLSAYPENIARERRQYAGSDAPFAAPEYNPKIRHPAIARSRKIKIIIISVCVLLLVLLGVGLGVGLTLKKDKKATYTVPTCSGSMTGASCDLEAACVCTSTSVCSELAQSLVSLTPVVNQLFNLNYTTKKIADSVWLFQGSPSGSCTNQALIVDVGPNLNVHKYPNRTQFIRSAMLWNTVISQDNAALATMQKFVIDAPWEKLDADGPASTSTDFTLSVSGFLFDFLAQTVSQPSVSFVTQSQASSSQISQVGDQAKGALDRMYSFAQASSTQQQVAMRTYWRSVLQQSVSDLPAFLAAITRAQIIVPFDSTAAYASDILSRSNSSLVPISCYPGLNASYANLYNKVETSVFNLPALAPQTQFDATCSPARPIYGVLDVLRLRLPFVDTRTGTAKQGMVLDIDVGSRAVVRSGEVVGALLHDVPADDDVSSLNLNPRLYGTLNNLNHIMLAHLMAIPDVNVAIAFVKYVLDAQKALPPQLDSILGQSLPSIPPLEVAVFGTVRTSDVDHTVSSFATPSGTLYFGSRAASTWRQWAISSIRSSVAWAESATSARVVRDSVTTDNDFNQVWTSAQTALDARLQNVGVSNITSALDFYNKFSP